MKVRVFRIQLLGQREYRSLVQHSFGHQAFKKLNIVLAALLRNRTELLWYVLGVELTVWKTSLLTCLARESLHSLFWRTELQRRVDIVLISVHALRVAALWLFLYVDAVKVLFLDNLQHFCVFIDKRVALLWIIAWLSLLRQRLTASIHDAWAAWAFHLHFLWSSCVMARGDLFFPEWKQEIFYRVPAPVGWWPEFTHLRRSIRIRLSVKWALQYLQLKLLELSIQLLQIGDLSSSPCILASVAGKLWRLIVIP